MGDRNSLRYVACALHSFPFFLPLADRHERSDRRTTSGREEQECHSVARDCTSDFDAVFLQSVQNKLRA